MKVVSDVSYSSNTLLLPLSGKFLEGSYFSTPKPHINIYHINFVIKSDIYLYCPKKITFFMFGIPGARNHPTSYYYKYSSLYLRKQKKLTSDSQYARPPTVF